MCLRVRLISIPCSIASKVSMSFLTKNGLASVDFGSEVISGSGSLTINNLDLSLTTNDGTSKEISGKGTTTIVGESAHDLQPITDSLGVLTGYRETTSDAAGNQIVRMYDSERTLLTTESINTASNGNVFTEMRDANGNFQSLTGVIQNADGSTMTAHYSGVARVDGMGDIENRQRRKRHDRLLFEHRQRHWKLYRDHSRRRHKNSRSIRCPRPGSQQHALPSDYRCEWNVHRLQTRLDRRRR